MKARIVRFSDATFGVRRRSSFYLWLRYEFLDLKSPEFWWSNKSTWIADCHGTEEQASAALARLYDNGTPL